jgi:UDP-2,3-diacylglucosamine hydrolase
VDIWLLSDIHLKSREERNSELLLRFLRSLVENERPVSHLIFLGDIFDLWIGGHEVFIKRWEPHINLIRDLIQKKKVEMIFVEGNHDVHISPFWEERLGARVFTDPTNIFIKPFKIHLEHGDLINKNDINYLRYREIIRSSPLKFLGLSLPGVFWDWLGTYLSKKSGAQSRQIRADRFEQMRSLIREHAVKLAKQPDAADYIFTGHFHIKDEFEVLSQGKRVKSVNLGSWLGEVTEVYHLNEDGGEFVVLS